MKAVDITLLIQIFNFFIAYIVLRTYVFVPSVTILEKEEMQDHALQKLVEDSLEKKHKAEEEMKLRAIEIKSLLQRAMPLQDGERHKDILQIRDMVVKKAVLSEQERNNIKKVIEGGLSKVSL